MGTDILTLETPFSAAHAAEASPKIRLGLVLPGGGALIKFTHGALKELARDPGYKALMDSGRLEIVAITGTSAGAVEGTVLTGHLNAGKGLQSGLNALDHIWTDVSDLGMASGMRQSFIRSAFPYMTPSYPNVPKTEQLLFQTAVQLMPEGATPHWIADRLAEEVPDWRNVQEGPVSLYLNAVRAPDKNQPKASHVTFSGKDITPETAASSTALKIFGGITINGVKYWDGGYWRNPCMEGIMTHDLTDIMVFPLCAPPANILPSRQDDWSTSGRLTNKETVSVELYHELAAMQAQAETPNQHVIYLQQGAHWDETAKMNNDPRFMRELEQQGRAAMRAWLDTNLAKLGNAHSFKPQIGAPAFLPQAA
jgi:NTE family protein